MASYELSKDDRRHGRICLNETAKTLAEARKMAQRTANDIGSDVMIEKVTSRNSTVVERVRAEAAK